MAEQRLRPLSGSGAVAFNTRFAKKASATLTGNVTLTLAGMTNNGKNVSLWVKQDATGGRTLTITPASGGANVMVGPSTDIEDAAGLSSKIDIALVNGVYNIGITVEQGI